MPTTSRSPAVSRYCNASVSRTWLFFICLLASASFHAPISNAQDAQWKIYKPNNASTSSEKDSVNKLTLLLLEPESVLSANFPDVITFGAWMNQVSTICEDILAKEKTPPQLLVQVTLRKDAAPVFELSGNPALGAELTKSLRTALAGVPDLRPPLSTVSFRLQQIDPEAAANPDVNPLKLAESFSPELVPPEQRELDAYHKSSIAGQYAALRKWAREQALPLLSSSRSVDEKFAGVRSIGNMLASLSFDKPLDVEKLTFQNPDYWRGVMEMAPGNHQVIAASVLLFVANGEMDKAAELLRYVQPFSLPGSLASAIYDGLETRLNSLNSNVDWEIKQGIALHDAGKYDEAMAAYKKLLADYPCSAWARYELFFSEVTKKSGLKQESVYGVKGKNITLPGEDLWEKAAPGIYNVNPLCTSQFMAKRGVSMGSVLDRLALADIRKNRPADYGEYFGRAAQIMVNLGAYGYAAHVYWLTLPTKIELKESDGKTPKSNLLPVSKEDTIGRFLYCLEKLGCPDLKKNFKDDFEPMFQEMDLKLKQHREQ